MPYIGINTSKKLSHTEKEELKAALGEKIAIIPGKNESKLMVDISDGHAMYFGGEARDLAFVDVRSYGKNEFADKKAFTEAAFEAIQKTTGVPQDGIYLTYGEYDTWGVMGSMK